MLNEVVQSIPIEEFIKLIEEDNIKVEYGLIFAGVSHPKKHLINKLEYHIFTIKRIMNDNSNVTDPLDPFNEYLYKEGGPLVIKRQLDGSLRTWSFEPITIRSHVVDKEILLIWEGDTLYFKEMDYDVLHVLNQIQDTHPDYLKGLKKLYKKIDVPNDILKPFKDSIAIPSKKFFIANYLTYNDATAERGYLDLNKEPPFDRELKVCYSLCALLGRKNLTHYSAKENNIAYGQMGNMSIDVWQNGRECILCTSYLENHAAAKGDSRCKESLKLLKYLKKGKFIYMNDISLSVWRWEATDYEQAQICMPFIEEHSQDYVTFPIEGTKATFEHYYDNDSHSSISTEIYSHFWFTE